MKTVRLLITLLILSMALLSLRPTAFADEYDDSQSHPLRLAAYVLHPVGVFLEWFAARPFHAIVSATPETEYIFGHRPHPPLFAQLPAYDYGISKRVSMRNPQAPKMAVRQEPVSEKVTVKEVPVEKIVVKEAPKDEVERIIFPDVAFRFDSTQLTELGKGKVYLVAQKLKENTDIVVVIEGHADYIGSEEYNQRLGLRRAETVMKELAGLGIDPKRMSVASFGESKPVIDQQTDWARAVNRRVEFRIAAP